MSGQLDSYQSDFAQLHSPSFSISNFWTQGPLRKNHGPGVPSTGCFSASLEALVRLWSIDVNRRELDKSLQWKSLNEIPPHSQKLPETFDRILLLFWCQAVTTSMAEKKQDCAESVKAGDCCSCGVFILGRQPCHPQIGFWNIIPSPFY